MLDVSTHKWKYLRECEDRFFDSNRNTALKQYLSTIYPHQEFVYDKPIPKDIIQFRCADAEIRRFRPDARCESLNLIVEFDGLPHYQDTAVILSDQNKDAYLARLGYQVIRIPYWIQLSNIMINCLFNIEVDEEMCTLSYSFSDNPSDDFGLSTCPGSMCEAGRYRMMEQFKLFPHVTQIAVLQDLQRCIDNRPNGCPRTWIVPDELWCNLVEIARLAGSITL